MKKNLIWIALALSACGDPTAPLEAPPVAEFCVLSGDDCGAVPGGGGGPGEVEIDFRAWTNLASWDTDYDVRARIRRLTMGAGSRTVYFSSPGNDFDSCSGDARKANDGSYFASCRIGAGRSGGGLRCDRTYAVDVTYSYIDETGSLKWITVRENVAIC